MDFSKAGELLKLQQEAMKIKKELENTFIESEVSGLVITVNGEMKVDKVEFETDMLIPGLSDGQKSVLQSAIMDAVNKGIKKSQEVAADKMKGVMGQMGINLPGGGLPGM
jgi:DNA-binding protein YbaB